MKKLLLVCTLLMVLTGCELLTGERIETVDPVTGITAVTYKKPVVEEGLGLLDLLVPGLGGLSVILFGAAKKAARAKNAFLEANKEVIENGDYKKLANAKNMKLALKTAQELHPEAQLMAAEYKKWKAKKAKKG